MILIVDSNIVFSGLLKEGKTRDLLIDSPYQLYAPETLISEIRKYESSITERSGLSKEEFELLFDIITEKITIIPKENYISFMNEAEKIIGHIDKKDIPFVALALSIKMDGIWSDDKDFLKQQEIKVYTTEELIKSG